MENKYKGWQRVLLLILPYIIIAGLFEFIGSLITQVNIMDLNYIRSSEQELIMMLFSTLGTFLVICLFMKYVDKENFIKLGFHTKNRGKDFIIGFAIGGIIMSLGYLFLLFFKEINFQKITFDFKDLLFSIILFFLVATTEEVLLRGYILRNLMLSFNKYVALLLSSIIFAAMHLFNPNIDLFSTANIFLAGLLLGISYINTKNLWFSIALHFSWNFFQTIFGFNVSGQDFYSLIEFKTQENNTLNGGDFGFEGSILSVFFMLIVIIGIGFYYNRKPIVLDLAE